MQNKKTQQLRWYRKQERRTSVRIQKTANEKQKYSNNTEDLKSESAL